MPDARSSVTTSKTNELRQDCYTHVNHEKLKPGAKGLAHNWFDGIHTFMPYICHKSWLGGWLMPQQKSYFAILLPKRWWWVFGLDLVLHGDIDVYKFKFFYELISEKRMISFIMTHESSWLLDWYWNHTSGKKVTYLISDHLKGRCKLRIAGDLHHYMHHTYVLSDELVYVQHLCVNGSVGAFLRPTHVFGNFKNVYNTSYEMAVAYPSCEDSSRMSTIGKSSDILWHECSVKKANMEELLKLKGCLIWITGLSGSVIWTPYPG